MIAVLKLGKQQQFLSVVLLIIDEQLKILLESLVDMFCLAITLWVVGGGCHEFVSELGNELGASVRHNLSHQTMVFPHMHMVLFGYKKLSLKPGFFT